MRRSAGNGATSRPKRYVYFWVDGIYFSARMEEEKQCILVIVGATDKGQKELIAIADGYRESEQSWLEVLLDLKRRGLEMGPQLALGDGALGFWKALRQVYPGAREQRCWVHKTGNVLNKLPKGLQKKAKGRLQDIWMAETRKDAESAFDFFLEAYGPKYDKAAACLAKDRDVLLTFYDFPAEHTGSMYARPTPSRARSPRFVCAPTGPRAACRARRRWPWSSNYASALRENGENSMDRTISPRSFAASNS